MATGTRWKSHGEAGSFAQIGRGARVDGKLKGAGLVVTCGRLEGEIDLDGVLVVAAEGQVDVLKGRMRTLSVEGEVRGLFRVGESLELKPGGVFEGEVETARLHAAPSSRLDATVRIGAEPA